MDNVFAIAIIVILILAGVLIIGGGIWLFKNIREYRRGERK